jgi:hypothetical protein
MASSKLKLSNAPVPLWLEKQDHKDCL